MPRPPGEYNGRAVIAVVNRREDSRWRAAPDVAGQWITDGIDKSNHIVDRHLPLAGVEAGPRGRSAEASIMRTRYRLRPAAPDGR